MANLHLLGDKMYREQKDKFLHFLSPENQLCEHILLETNL